MEQHEITRLLKILCGEDTETFAVVANGHVDFYSCDKYCETPFPKEAFPFETRVLLDLFKKNRTDTGFNV